MDVISIENTSNFGLAKENIQHFDEIKILGGYLLVSSMFKSPKNIEVPDIVGLTIDEAKVKLQEQELSYEIIDQIYSKEIEAIQFGFFPFLVKTREIRYLTIPNLGNGASYYAVTCYGTNNEQETHYVLTLKNSISDFTYYMDFGELEGEDDPYYDYLVAMAYSFNRQ